MNNLINITDGVGRLTEDNGYVYIIEKQDGTVKIGKSRQPSFRIANIANLGGFEVIQKYISPVCSNYSKIEAKLHVIFKENRLVGEWFGVPFKKVVDTLENMDFAPIIVDTAEAIEERNRRMNYIVNEFILKIPMEEISSIKENLSELPSLNIEKTVEEILEKVHEHSSKLKLTKYIWNALGRDAGPDDLMNVKQRVLLMLNGQAWQDIPYEKLIKNMSLIDESIRAVKSFRTKSQISLFEN